MIVITGMHRSGTSAVAMTMASLGLDFGDTAAFYGADEWNERGYYERRDVIDLNSRIISGFPRTRGAVTTTLSQLAYLAVPSRRAIRRRATRLQDEVDLLVGRIDKLAVKDPRFCLTLSAWAPHVDRTIVCLRHPLAVARSLKRRQRVPMPVGLRFFDRHAAALLAWPDDHALYVDFDVLVGDGGLAELARISAYVGLDTDEDALRAARNAGISPKLRHFTTEDDGSLPPRTQRLWARLQQRREPTTAP